MMERVRSTQKLPIVAPLAWDAFRVRPLARAKATAMPAPAETKFCQARAAIWTR